MDGDDERVVVVEVVVREAWHFGETGFRGQVMNERTSKWNIIKCFEVWISFQDLEVGLGKLKTNDYNTVSDSFGTQYDGLPLWILKLNRNDF